MPKWEYSILHTKRGRVVAVNMSELTPGPNLLTLPDALNNMGREGWELVIVTSSKTGASRDYIFKRERK